MLEMIEMVFTTCKMWWP